ncbi:XPC-binding domain family protein [Leishmania donovani]|uniref:XPC-binding domain family protein n=1 Tax=Leishmania donovani TaxID=5661 RepID=A0A504Y011_LEIDO|nr:XPC-binding domain family protein [Leishmania donovani]
MKFTVTCLVSSVNSSLLAESEAVTKEITVANPRATVQNLRATVAIQFRLKVVAFEFRFDRHEGATESDSAAPSSSPSAASAVVDFGDEKKLLTECGLQEGDHLTVVPKNYSSLSAAGAAAVTASEASSSEVPATKRVRIESRGEVDAPAGQNDLFAALREVVPDLTVLRQEFLANPQAVMERIERNHPSLFQVIVQNQETFVTLMNNEQLTKAAQSMLHGGTMGGDEDEDEGGSLDYITSAARSGDSGDFDAADLAELEASGMHEDEKKIQALTELGFTYEQCKVAFYLCHRSIDRASNMLFEAPPEI